VFFVSVFDPNKMIYHYARFSCPFHGWRRSARASRAAPWTVRGVGGCVSARRSFCAYGRGVNARSACVHARGSGFRFRFRPEQNDLSLCSFPCRFFGFSFLRNFDSAFVPQAPMFLAYVSRLCFSPVFPPVCRYVGIY